MQQRHEEAKKKAMVDSDRFDLFHGCDPIFLEVWLHDDKKTVEGLTEERLRFAAESRLRSARVYVRYASGFNTPRLRVSASVGKYFFTVSVAFSKTLHDLHSELRDFVVTWERDTVQPHQRLESALLDLSGFLDEFLAEYLRVNEEACKSDSQPAVPAVGDILTTEELDRLQDAP